MFCVFVCFFWERCLPKKALLGFFLGFSNIFVCFVYHIKNMFPCFFLHVCVCYLYGVSFDCKLHKDT